MHRLTEHINSRTKQHSPLQKEKSVNDSISIGTQARQLFNQYRQSSSLVESLMKQRESIQEMKSHLTERALEQGTDPSALKEQMKALEQQLSEIDAQIAQAQKEKQEPTQTNNQKQSAQTAEEAILSQAHSLEQTKTLNRIDDSLNREQTSLKTEMKLDASRGVHSEFKANRLTKIDDQLSFVYETLTTEIVETHFTNDNQKQPTDETLSLQQQLHNSIEDNIEDNEDEPNCET